MSLPPDLAPINPPSKMDPSRPPVICTSRLRLRLMADPPAENHAPSSAWLRDLTFYASLRADETTIRYAMDGIPDANLQATEKWMRRQAGRQWGGYVAEMQAEEAQRYKAAKDKGEEDQTGDLSGEGRVVIGGVGIILPSEKKNASRESEERLIAGTEMGYMVHADYRGRGYATEMVRGLLDTWMAVTGTTERSGDEVEGGEEASTASTASIGAETDAGNEASQSVLRKCGFRLVPQDKGRKGEKEGAEGAEAAEGMNKRGPLVWRLDLIEKQ